MRENLGEPLENGQSRFENSFDRAFVSPPLVSVIVTCYNYERYIADCLRSIVKQSYERIECIVVDDCSSDNSAQVIRDFIADTKGAADFRLVSNETNGGQMRSFLTGFRNSSGTFVVFVDADDMLFPNFVETHVKAHLNFDFVAGLSCSDEIVVDGSNTLMAGSMENSVKGSRRKRWFSGQLPLAVTEVSNWQTYWAFGQTVDLSQTTGAILFIAPSGNPLHHWIWTTTSAVMFRRGVLDLALTEEVADIRICSDFFLLHFAHLIGGTLLIPNAHGCYRRHGANHFATNALVGTGMRAGPITGELSFKQMWKRVRSEATRQFKKLSSLMGEHRAMRILATVGSFRDCLEFCWAEDSLSPTHRLQLLIMFALIRTKRFLLFVRRAVRMI